MARIIKCAPCGRHRPVKARGWCGACYGRWLARGKPAGGPPPLGPVQEAPAAPRVQNRPEWTGQQQRAARMVAASAVDADDCRLLLGSLGLLPGEDTADEPMGGAA
ncbi:hypothetical protein [Streptomyces sp. C1-2]|uniref:hypothetical protein n=1 Tax=Streptomyces sp. C1-2 TaxID=2720022 RepID=UPI00143246CE|nr:hypothetical protein [Streptomyces sp. C1-2]NJP71931.1 hypothetical protein [Streptomyces sp. C1-2]